MHSLIDSLVAQRCWLIGCCLLSSVSLSGCVSPRSVLFTDGPTMRQVLDSAQSSHRQGAQPAGEDDVQRQLRLAAHVNPQEVVRYDAFTRDSLNEIQQLFPRLRNPRFALYINPHLSTTTRAPVPGYTTEFSLYDRDVYALPEEVPPDRYPTSADMPGPVDEIVVERGAFQPGIRIEEAVR